MQKRSDNTLTSLLRMIGSVCGSQASHRMKIAGIPSTRSRMQFCEVRDFGSQLDIPPLDGTKDVH